MNHWLLISFMGVYVKSEMFFLSYIVNYFRSNLDFIFFRFLFVELKFTNAII